MSDWKKKHRVEAFRYIARCLIEEEYDPLEEGYIHIEVADTETEDGFRRLVAQFFGEDQVDKAVGVVRDFAEGRRKRTRLWMAKDVWKPGDTECDTLEEAREAQLRLIKGAMGRDPNPTELATAKQKLPIFCITRTERVRPRTT